jgi:SAM-dependent methyltransferase
MKNIIVVLQASSRSWSGGADLCMNLMEGRTVLANTLGRVLSGLPFCISGTYLIAPEFDRGGMDFLLKDFPDLKISYGYDSSPLLRMLAIIREMNDEDYVLRINGINFCVDLLAAGQMLELVDSQYYDCIKFPDDFPALFTCDLYGVRGLRKMQDELSNVDPIYHVHPKYYMSIHERYSCLVLKPNLTSYTDNYLQSARKKYSDSMHAKRIEVDGRNAIVAGDSIVLHYELARNYIAGKDIVLDMACGDGFGSNILVGSAGKVVGVDLDSAAIEQAKRTFFSDDAEFIQCDVLNMPYENEFDVIAAFEIIEHVPPVAFLRSVFRALKAGGLLLLSTPQNSLGHIPTTSDHIREYSLSEIETVVDSYFEIEKIIGIKQGCVYFDGDPVGSNTFLVARKRTFV